ncbi:MAG: hypothetical protein K5695_12255 [Oscillospiraceae bacterium]|nr:hypothetical protein [Oscillospiraceae bacterium]
MKFGRMICILALAGAALCLVGCDDTAPDSFGSSSEEVTETELVTLSSDEVSSIAEAIPPHPETPVEEDTTEPLSTEDTTLATAAANTLSPFGKAVYLGRSSEWSERFFYFLDGTSGNCISQEDGSNTAFHFSMDGKDKITIRFGDAGAQTADVFWTDEDTAMLYWEDGKSETLVKVSDDTAGFRFLSNDVLIARATALYESKTGEKPALANVTLSADEMVSVRLYDDIEGHNATCEWYTVNRYTGIGTNIMGEAVNLGDLNVQPSATEPTETQPASENVTEPATEATEPTT